MRPEVKWLLVGPARECRYYAREKGLKREEWRNITSPHQLRGLEGPLRNTKSPLRLRFVHQPWWADGRREMWAMARSRGFIE